MESQTQVRKICPLGPEDIQSYNNKILCIIFLRSFGKVETTSNNHLPINDHNFVMSDSMPIVNKGWYPCITKKMWLRSTSPFFGFYPG